MSYLIVSASFAGLLGLAAGVGMWLAKPWGWWLAIYYYLLTVLGALTGALGSLGQEPSISTLYHYGWRLILGVGVVIYFHTDKIRQQFGVSHRSKWVPLLVLLAAAIGTQVAFLALAVILTGMQ